MIEVVGMVALVGAAVAFGVAPSHPLENCDPESARAQSMRRAELRGSLMLAIGGLTAGLTLHAFTSGSAGVGLVVFFLGAMTMVVMQPGVIVRAVLVPMGAWQWARAASRWGGPPWLRDPEGGAALMGVLALRQRPSANVDAAAEDLETGLMAAPLRGAGLVAAGLLADLRSNATEARRILLSVDDLDPDACPPLARAIANDWLLDDAANRERWGEVDARSEHALSLSASGRLLHTVAQRLLGRASRLDLLKAWMLAPKRWQTLSLLDRAWDDSESIEYPVVDHDLTRRAANGHGLLGTGAASLHLDAIAAHRRGELRADVLERLGLAWDETLWDVGLRRRVRGRSIDLDCDATVEESMIELHRALCVEVASMMPPRGDIPRRGKTLTRAIGLFSSAQELRIKQAALRLERAMSATVSPTATELWNDWLEIRDGYALHHRADVADLKALFQRVDAAMSPVVHWMWHARGERPMANAIATWLALEADRVSEEDAARYHRQYVA
ncbi:MAG: hypothetical protein AAGA54_11400, partial [Myxococcota bacterium]